MDPNEIAAANEGAHVPVEFDPASGRFQPRYPMREGGFGEQGINRMPGLVRDLDKLGDYETMMQVLRGHGLDPAEYLQHIHGRLGE